MPENHLFNTHKTDLFSKVMPDNSQLLIPSAVNWIFQVPQTSLTGDSLKPDSRDCRRNPALTAVQGNSVPASYRGTNPQLHVSWDFSEVEISTRFLRGRDFYQVGVSGLPFQRLSSIKHPRTFIKPGKDLQQALEVAASLTPTAFHMLHFLTKMGSLYFWNTKHAKESSNVWIIQCCKSFHHVQFFWHFNV